MKLVDHTFSASIASYITHVYLFSFSSLQFTGIYTVNNELQKAQRLFEGELFGPESLAVDEDGEHSRYRRNLSL